MAAVFVSYRRGAAAGSAGRLYDALVGRFDEASVFMDVDNIRPGDDFVEVLDQTLAACRAVVVVIDPEWLYTQDRHGRRRLDNPRDFVRLEVEHALRSGVRVIPALVDDAEMPSADELPPSISALANRQAVEISATRFRYDVGRLIDAVEWAVQGAAPPMAPPRPASSPLTSRLTAAAPPNPLTDPVPPPPHKLKLHYDISSRPIAATMAEVWDVLVDVARYPRHHPWIVSVEPLTAAPPCQGYRYRAKYRALRVLVASYDEEMTEFEPPHRLTTTEREVGNGRLWK